MSTGASDSQTLLYIDDLNVALHFATNIGKTNCKALDLETNFGFVTGLIASGAGLHTGVVCIGLNAFLVAAGLPPNDSTSDCGM